MKNGSMCEMEHIVEPIPARLTNVVRQRIPDEYTIPLHITLSGFPLDVFDLKIRWNSLFSREIVIKGW